MSRTQATLYATEFNYERHVLTEQPVHTERPALTERSVHAPSLRTPRRLPGVRLRPGPLVPGVHALRYDIPEGALLPRPRQL
jgi:hypothetical protein